MAKKNDEGKNTFKVFQSDKLERFDLENEKKLAFANMNFFMKCTNQFTEGKIPEEMEDLHQAIFILLMSLFWKIYNSYDKYQNIPPDVFNTYAYLMYHNELFKDGIYFSNIANEIEESSMYLDTIDRRILKVRKL